MWALVRSLARGRMYWGLFAAAVIMIVLSDSRFGAMFCILAACIAVLPPAIGAATAMSLPGVALAALIFLPDHLEKMHVIGNGFVSRLILSGHFIAALDLQNWLGIMTPDFQPFDSGYAYSFIGFGVVGAAALWAVFWTIDGRGWQFHTYKNLVAAYYGVLLCVSNSPYTIKTASLLWFLLGALSAARVRRSCRRADRRIRITFRVEHPPRDLFPTPEPRRAGEASMRQRPAHSAFDAVGVAGRIAEAVGAVARGEARADGRQAEILELHQLQARLREVT
jgi:putative polymerase